MYECQVVIYHRGANHRFLYAWIENSEFCLFWIHGSIAIHQKFGRAAGRNRKLGLLQYFLLYPQKTEKDFKELKKNEKIWTILRDCKWLWRTAKDFKGLQKDWKIFLKILKNCKRLKKISNDCQKLKNYANDFKKRKRL